MNNTNHLISSDNKGYAAILFEQMMNNGSLPGKVFIISADWTRCLFGEIKTIFLSVLFLNTSCGY